MEFMHLTIETSITPGQGGDMRGIFMVLEGMVRAWRWGFLRIYIHRSGGARWGFDLCLVSSR